ncbi:MAG TPA: acetyl-CoA C-acetyltransferase [Bdellovibrionota bacterium]|nr:acetyl-CoA C-acetyltransferase [Bdellovibrionota bacterium]
MPTDSLVFLSGKRTPFGANGGSLKDTSATDLALVAAKAALEQSKVPADAIDHVIFGSLVTTSGESIYLPRHVGLKAGIPQGVPALGVNRLCGTGFQAIIEAWHQMLAGDTKIALVGGVENMSQAPYIVGKARWGLRMGNQPMTDLLIDSLYDTYPQMPMAITAENLAESHQISREQSDDFALRSQRLTQEALKANRFADELAPVTVQDRKGSIEIAKDEHPRADASKESLGKLKAVFKKDGVVTAGNASGIVDGAAALVVSTESEAKRRNLQPLGRLVAYGISGCDPKIMGIGPVPAARQALQRAKLTLDQMDLIEVNEAFAPQTLAVAKDLRIPLEKLNVDGGAIAIGHPLAASGARITMHLLYELRRRKKRYGLGSACIGGGQGIALVIEAFH